MRAGGDPKHQAIDGGGNASGTRRSRTKLSLRPGRHTPYLKLRSPQGAAHCLPPHTSTFEQTDRQALALNTLAAATAVDKALVALFAEIRRRDALSPERCDQPPRLSARTSPRPRGPRATVGPWC